MNELEIKLQQAVLPFDVKGQKTVPVVSIDDPGFVYQPAIKTNLANTFARAISQLGERTKEKVAA